MSEKQVLIVGAGPVGLFTALRLAQAGIEVNVIERLPERSTAPRAAGHYGASLMALKNAKIYEKMLAAGDLQDGFGWRAAPVPNEKGIKSLGKQLGALRIYQNEDTDAQVGGMLVLPQADFTRILEEEVLSTGKVHIHYSQELVDLDDTGSAVKITTKDTGTGKLTNFTGSYLVGADGGKSSVRKLKDIDLGGHTWPERLIATDVWLKNEEVGQPPSHFVVAPVNWGVVISLTKPTEGEYSLWRYTVSVPPEDTRTDDEVMEPASLEKFYENMMPGKRPLQQYEVLRKAIYYIHQRLASTMFRGRCLLAGDAAHLCNVSTQTPCKSSILTSCLADRSNGARHRCSRC